MSNVKKSNSWTMEEVCKKIDMIGFTDIDVDFNTTCEGHQNWSKYFLSTF